MYIVDEFVYSETQTMRIISALDIKQNKEPLTSLADENDVIVGGFKFGWMS